MAIPLIINGVTFQYPQQFDKNWGPTLTNWSSAVTSGMLQKAGGSFTLTAEVDFGASFGMKVLSIKSEDSNIAATGFLRLANASAGIVWRNAAHNADLALTVNASNQLTFNGVNVGATTSLTDSHVLVGNVSNQPADVAMSGDITITNAGVTSIGSGKIVNAQIGASAAIALSKLAPTTAYYWYVANTSGVLTPQGVTASMAVATDSNGLPTASSTTATELGYVHGVTSAIQTQVDAKLPLSGGTMSGVLNMGSKKITSLAQGGSTGEALAYGQGFDAGSHKITGLAAPTANGDAVANSVWTAYTPAFDSGFGTVTNVSFFWRQLGDTLQVRGYFKSGTVTAATADFSLPSGKTIDFTKIPSGVANTAILGQAWWLSNSTFQATGPLAIFSDGSSTGSVFITGASTSTAFTKANASAIMASSNGLAVQFEVPVS